MPKVSYQPKQDLIPASMLICGKINEVPSMQLLCILFDSSGTGTMIHWSALPKGCTPTLLDKPVVSKTIEGTFTSMTSVQLSNVILAEFDCSKIIDEQGAFIFDGDSRYNIILG